MENVKNENFFCQPDKNTAQVCSQCIHTDFVEIFIS